MPPTEQGTGSFHVGVRLPDGRDVYADYRHPIVHVMRRVLDRRMMMGLNIAEEASAGDYAVIGRWLDRHPGEACSPYHCVMHGPAGDEPAGFRPPPYREDPPDDRPGRGSAPSHPAALRRKRGTGPAHPAPGQPE